MRNKKWLIIVAVFLVLVIASWLWWQSSSSAPMKKEVAQRLTPEISVASLNISDIDDDRIKLSSKVTISNPLPVDINTNRLSYEIFIDSARVMKDSYDKPISIRSSDSTVIELPMELLIAPLAHVLKYFDDHKIASADYSIKATFLVDVPIAGERSFTMNLSKRLPALHIPKMKVKDVDLHALSMKKKGVDMVVHVTNPNRFAIKMKDASFALNVEDDIEMAGVLEKIVDIPANGLEDISMHADVKEGKVLKAGWKLLTDKKDTHFKYKFTCKLLSENEMFNNSTMATTITGTIDELLNAVK